MGVTASKKREAAKCKICGEEFIKVHRKNVYCSKVCRDEAQSRLAIERRGGRLPEIRDTCVFCGKPITQLSRYRPRKFCSKKCGATFHKQKYKLMREEKPKPIQKRMTEREPEDDRYRYHCFFCPMKGWRCRTSNILPCYKRSRLNKEYREKVEYWNSLADV